MRRGLRRAAIGLGLAAGVALAIGAAAPRILDRVYYRGPPSDHFDGKHFFNPEDAASGTPERQGFSLFRFARFVAGMDRAPWPRHVAVRQTSPIARVAGDALRVTWIGHSTMLVQSDGLNILTDPIWSTRASPFSFIGPERVRAPGVAFEALPRIDAVLVSHNHYDHLDFPTLKRLWARDRPRIIVPLGTDTILRAAGVPAIARDWGGHVEIAPGAEVVLARVHHWTSRWGADRNRALWTGYEIRLPSGNIFFAGDTGLGDGSWVRTAARGGPYRLALIPIGAFEPRRMMQASHIGPAEAADVFRTLGAAYGVAIHWGTFRLSAESFDAPPRLLKHTLDTRGVAPGRFRALVPGIAWDVPAR